MAALAFAAPALLPAQAPNKTAGADNSKNVVAMCMAGGRPCDGGQIKQLMDGLATGRRVHQTLAAIKSVSMGGSGGTLACEQTNGMPCTEEQVKALNQIAPPNCRINYNSSKSNSGFDILKQPGKSSPR